MSDQDQVRLRDVLGLPVVPDYTDALPEEEGWYWIKTPSGHHYVAEIVELSAIPVRFNPAKLKTSLFLHQLPLERFSTHRFAGPIPKPSNAR